MLVEHHVKYKEIHGVDETVWMTISEHRKLHHRLRKEGKCNIPSKTLKKITHNCYHRTEKGKRYDREYAKTEKNKANIKKYHKTNYRVISFSDMVTTNVQFIEQLLYNTRTGSITWSARFRPVHKAKLYEFNI